MSDQGLVKSAARAFAILEAFGQARRPLRLRDLVGQLGFPRSSVAELLKSMTAQGYLSFDTRTHAYMPSARLAALVAWVPADDFEQSVVLPAMRALRDATGELVVLGTPSGIHLDYVESLRATEPIQLYIAPGTRRLLVQNAAGWLLLAHGPRDAAMALYDRTIEAGELTTAEFSRADFAARLDEHAKLRTCFSTARDYVRPTAHWRGALAAFLVPTPPGHRPLIIGIGGLAEQLIAKRPLIEAAMLAEREKMLQK